MAGSRWERLAAASGGLFVVLFVAGAVIGGMAEPLDFNQLSDQGVRAYFARNGPKLAAMDRLIKVSLFFFLLYLGGLGSALRRAEGGAGGLAALALGGGVATAALLLAVTAAYNVAPHLVEEPAVGKDVVHGLLDLAFPSVLFLTAVPLAALLTATALVSLRTPALPRWLGRAAALLALVFLAAGVADPLWLPAFPLFLLWVLASSVVLLRRAGHEESRPMSLPSPKRSPDRG